MRRNSLILSLLAPFFALAQRENPSLFELQKSLAEPPRSFVFEPNFDARFFEKKSPRLAPFSFFEKPTSAVCKKFSPDDLAFFCRIEHRAAKKSPTAVKFRLGSVEYVDFLEGKN